MSDGPRWLLRRNCLTHSCRGISLNSRIRSWKRLILKHLDSKIIGILSQNQCGSSEVSSAFLENRSSIKSTCHKCRCCGYRQNSTSERRWNCLFPTKTFIFHITYSLLIGLTEFFASKIYLWLAGFHTFTLSQGHYPRLISSIYTPELLQTMFFRRLFQHYPRSVDRDRSIQLAANLPSDFAPSGNAPTNGWIIARLRIKDSLRDAVCYTEACPVWSAVSHCELILGSLAASVSALCFVTSGVDVLSSPSFVCFPTSGVCVTHLLSFHYCAHLATGFSNHD